MTLEPDRWNHNLHYHPLILAAVPVGARRVLDVGCGEGILARQLAGVADHVTAIDVDEASIRLAREAGLGPGPVSPRAGGIEFVHDDFRTHAFEPASFDFIASVATLHHLDPAETLNRMRLLLRPGGRLVVVGLARSSMPRDLPRDLVGFAAHRMYLLRRNYWEHSAPTVWPPPHTYREIREVAQNILPGVHFRRHLLWRFSLIWTKPAPLQPTRS
jgi:SAM-dependent methyltransferase